MKEIQEIFDRIQRSKEIQKELSTQYKDALEHEVAYQRIKDKMDKLREEKKSFELMVQDQMGKDWDKLERLKEDLKIDKEMLADVAIAQLANGLPVGVTDKDENEYEPLFTVRFRKI